MSNAPPAFTPSPGCYAKLDELLERRDCERANESASTGFETNYRVRHRTEGAYARLVQSERVRIDPVPGVEGAAYNRGVSEAVTTLTIAPAIGG